MSTLPITYRAFNAEAKEHDLEIVQKLISTDLSEPYSVYVYRYFVYEWPDLSFLVCYIHHLVWAEPSRRRLSTNEKAFDGDLPVGVIVCNMRDHRGCRVRGYIAMLAVKESYRGKGIAKRLITMAVEALKGKNCDEIMLETEVTNAPAMHLYENLGFLRSKRLHRYYLNANDAFRLILPLTHCSTVMSQFLRDPPSMGEII